MQLLCELRAMVVSNRVLLAIAYKRVRSLAICADLLQLFAICTILQSKNYHEQKKQCPFPCEAKFRLAALDFVFEEREAGKP